MKVIECRELTKSYGSFKALNNLSISIQENKITGLIGRNGAGKTTLLKILAGYWRESSGDVKVFSEKPFNNLFVSSNTILIDEHMSFPDTLTLREILKFAGRFYENWDMSFAKRLFNYFNFDEQEIYKNLSKGKKSTFNSIVGLSTRCALTLLDEPITGMDAAVRKDFYRALLRDYLAYPRTIIISSHHLNEIEDLLEDILLIGDGQKYLHLPIDDVKEYAIGIIGKTAIVQQWAGDKEVIFNQQVSEDDSYIVLKNEHPRSELERLGFEITPVTPNDLCIYLTNKTKGGIDDVFIKD